MKIRRQSTINPGSSSYRFARSSREARPPRPQPLNRSELEQWADRLAETAGEIRRERGECSPTALLVVNRIPIAIDAILQSTEDRHTLRSLFEIVARGGAEACALVAEGWQAGGTPRKLARAMQHASADRSLAELSGRREVLFVHAISPAGEAVRVLGIGKGGRLRRLPSDHAQPFVNRFLRELPWATKRLAKRRNPPD